MIDVIMGIIAPAGFVFSAILCALWRNAEKDANILADALERVENEHKAEIDKLKAEYDVNIKFYETVAKQAIDRADRNGAMAEGLVEDLAALRKYDPEKVDKQLKNIREIRANEELKKKQSELQEALFKAQMAMIMQVPYGGFMNGGPYVMSEIVNANPFRR